MASTTSACRHPDIRDFDGLKCCISCGLSYHELRSGSPEPDPVSEEAAGCRQRYRYWPLNYELGKEIRLPVLQPGEFEDPIRVHIVHANLLDDPQYEALSYTWATEDGDASLSRELDCKGKTVAITRNCEAALRRIRRPEWKRMIFVDAVCINQETIAERNHQVKLMGTIYSQVEQVLIYPSELHRDTIAALQTFKDGDAFPYELWYLVKKFLSRRWFRRIWVIQELVLARKARIILNQHVIVLSPEFVLRIRDLCAREGFDVLGPLAFDLGVRSHSLFLSLQATKVCEATDPKDKVFAIMGLLDPSIQSQLSVDYSCSVSEIYTAAVIAVILEQQQLSILSLGFGYSSIF
ncbi:heterokaryon incompatibility protein-domain-containing protein [Clohesyomyces aquaticus]|uniref:Heterokaryon incompatibility protein-domain-containing protein n=1 Tax=Clohesyomyces aquaticus TaxID=1231657 RepID=A0A1Y1ZKB6_9PLEO|nr:heterokaryon incompatibility protein-domain-containing protein [Clohesyomyces aquaticus]